ncbi:MAG: hypothetical protein GY943_17580 [Chloroflexi bacterium]|nr:hypothetical protein [Chloroflexota bacterium]
MWHKHQNQTTIYKPSHQKRIINPNSSYWHNTAVPFAAVGTPRRQD